MQPSLLSAHAGLFVSVQSQFARDKLGRVHDRIDKHAGMLSSIKFNCCNKSKIASQIGGFSGCPAIYRNP